MLMRFPQIKAKGRKKNVSQFQVLLLCYYNITFIIFYVPKAGNQSAESLFCLKCSHWMWWSITATHLILVCFLSLWLSSAMFLLFNQNSNSIHCIVCGAPKAKCKVSVFSCSVSVDVRCSMCLPFGEYTPIEFFVVVHFSCALSLHLACGSPLFILKWCNCV